MVTLETEIMGFSLFYSMLALLRDEWRFFPAAALKVRLTIAAAVYELFARLTVELAKCVSALRLVGWQSGAPLAVLLTAASWAGTAAARSAAIGAAAEPARAASA